MFSLAMRHSVMLFPGALFLARGSVRYCGCEDYRQHHARHVPPSVHVRRHWRSAVQGNVDASHCPFTPPVSSCEGIWEFIHSPHDITIIHNISTNRINSIITTFKIWSPSFAFDSITCVSYGGNGYGCDLLIISLHLISGASKI